MRSNQIVLWLLGGSGIFLLYCAVKNVSPSSLIQSYFDKSVTPKPLSTLTQSQVNDGVQAGGEAGGLEKALPKKNTYISPTGAVVEYPASYQSSPNTYIRT